MTGDDSLIEGGAREAPYLRYVLGVEGLGLSDVSNVGLRKGESAE